MMKDSNGMQDANQTDTFLRTTDQRHETASGSVSEDSSAEEASQIGSSKKRKRPTKISCELCKARKVKCDRAEPSCGWCTRNHRVCIYKERKRPSLRASYGVELEDKLNRIETTLYLLGRRVDEHISQHEGSNDRSALPHSAQSRLQLPPRSHSHDAYTMNASASPTPWLPPSTSNEIQPRSSQPFDTIAPSFAHSEGNAASAEPRSEPDKMLQLNNENDLPPPDMLYNLVDMYFKHIGTWSPILDRKATFDALFNAPDILREPEHVLLCAIVVVTLRFCKDNRLTGESRRHYHESARRRVQLYALENPSVTAMKALALITVDALGTTIDLKGFNLLALLVRSIVQLGLGVEKSVYLAPSSANTCEDQHQMFALQQPNSWIEDEGRRRLFWITYIIDRYATVAAGVDFVLDEQETDRSLPCRYDLFSKNEAVETRWLRNTQQYEISMDKPENLGSFSYHCEVLKILSQIHQFLRAPVDIESVPDVNQWREKYRELDSKLNTWLSHLPGEYGKISQLCHSDPGSRVSNWIMIHAAFVTSVIRLHSVAAYPASRSHIFMSSYNAVQRCLAAVESLQAIAQDVIDTGMLDLLGPPFAFSLWTSGRLLIVHAAVMESTVDPKIHFLISTLETMGQYWDIARKWAETLRRLVNEGEEADHASRNGRTAISGKTYIEMRRCAHDLVMLMARKPRTLLDPPATRTTSSHELEYLVVFEWFNYPRLPAAAMSHQATSNLTLGNMPSNRASASPNPDLDWLIFKQPYEFKPPYE